MAVVDMDGREIDDLWCESESDASLQAGPIILGSQAIAGISREALGAGRPIGLRISPDAVTEPLVNLLDLIDLIVIDFSSFRDGRGFTAATTLRQRHGFTGELRATGDILPDQFVALRECGFTTIKTPANHPPELWRRQLTAPSQGGQLLHRLLGGRNRPILHLRSR
jgi:uncharacterized protein (DUF934 family)